MPVKFQDFSMNVQAELNDVTIGWLYEASNEIKAQAQRDCKMTPEDHGQLKGSYGTSVNEGEGKADIGSPLESAYWEEWGTGEHAAHGDGRKGWWVYVKGSSKGDGGESYATEEEAKAVAESMRKRGLDAYHTNGREPNYTLEHAFDRKKNPVINRLKQMLKEGMDGK